MAQGSIRRFGQFVGNELLLFRREIARRNGHEPRQACNHFESDVALYGMRFLQSGQHLDISANQFAINIQLDVLALVIHADEYIEAPALETAREFLPDDVLEILILAGNLDVNVEIPVVHAFDLDQCR